jgi:hypothetical protein
MPRKPRRNHQTKYRLNATEIAYLSDDQAVSDEHNFTLWCYRHGLESFDGDLKPDQLWKKYRDDFLAAFIEKYPCRRPLAWWQWDGPRKDTGSGWFYEPLPIPRERVGGKGQAAWDAGLDIVPDFTYGLPDTYMWQDYDENDPPIFESQASYLLKHGLLSPAEKRHLRKHRELMEPERVSIDDENE